MKKEKKSKKKKKTYHHIGIMGIRILSDEKRHRKYNSRVFSANLGKGPRILHAWLVLSDPMKAVNGETSRGCIDQLQFLRDSVPLFLNPTKSSS